MMSTTPSLMEDIEAGQEYLTRALNEIDLDTPSPSSSVTLHRWLSVSSVLSAPSSLAIQQQEAGEDANLQVFRCIGKGFCAEIYDKLGTGRVYKRAFRPQDLQLWNDFEWHVKIFHILHHAIEGSPYNLSLPKVYSYINADEEKWWNKIAPNGR